MGGFISREASEGVLEPREPRSLGGRVWRPLRTSLAPHSHLSHASLGLWLTLVGLGSMEGCHSREAGWPGGGPNRVGEREARALLFADLFVVRPGPPRGAT